MDKPHSESKPKDLLEAILKGSTESMDDFLRNGADPDRIKSKPYSTCLAECVKRGTLEKLKILIDYGADINRCPHEGRTALHYAAMLGKLDFVKFLIDNSARVNAKDYQRLTPLDLASEKGNIDIVRYLLNHKARVLSAERPIAKESSIHLALNKGKTETAQILIERLDPEQDVTEYLNELLNDAIRSGHEEIVQSLLFRCVPIKRSGRYVYSPINTAAKYDRRKILSLLLTHGANVEEEDEHGYRPLMWAAKRGHGKVVEMLLSAGANPDSFHARSSKTVKLAAEELDFRDISKMIEEASLFNSA